MLSYLSSQSIYCGDVIQFKTCDNSNLSQASHIADICYVSTILKTFHLVVISFFIGANLSHRVRFFCNFVRNRIYVISKKWLQVVFMARYL